LALRCREALIADAGSEIHHVLAKENGKWQMANGKAVRWPSLHDAKVRGYRGRVAAELRIETFR
jgi:hypothetical protein